MVSELALGGSAVGTGMNTPAGYSNWLQRKLLSLPVFLLFSPEQI